MAREHARVMGEGSEGVLEGHVVGEGSEGVLEALTDTHVFLFHHKLCSFAFILPLV